MRTFVYIDGFNLYYRAVKGTPHKWLDPDALMRAVLQPHHRIAKIKYFTARVNATPTDPSKPQRQDVFLRALKAHIPHIEIFFGHFLSHVIKAPLAAPPAVGPRMVDIIKTEEKGSDVNIAVHLLNDAWLNLYDCAIVVSNDSDLAEAMRLVRLHHGKRIGLLTPGTSRPSQQLLARADFSRHIRPGSLAACQMPSPIPGTTITKPATW